MNSINQHWLGLWEHCGPLFHCALLIFIVVSLFSFFIMKNKMGLELVTSRCSGYTESSEKFPLSLDQFGDVIWTGLRVVAKFVSANLCKQIYDIINFPLSFIHLNLERVEKKGKSYNNLNIQRTKKAFHTK